MGMKRVEGLLVERAAGEVLVMKTGTEEAHALNPAAGVVFDLCDGTTSKEEMALEIERRVGLPADIGIVDLALAELIDAGLIVAEPTEPVPNFTRRSLLRRLALPATAVAMLPIVETIIVPLAAAQSSGTSPISIGPAPKQQPPPKPQRPPI